MAKNQVLEGTYKGQWIQASGDVILIGGKIINKFEIINYEVVTEDTRKSGTSMMLRGAVGIALLGNVGVLAALSAKNKSTYIIAIEWNKNFLNSKEKKKGTKSIIEIDEKIYKKLIKMMI